MAEDNNSRYTKNESVTSKGHYVRYCFSVNDFSTASTWQLQTHYFTRCRSVPTSWKIHLKGSSNSYSLTLTRDEGLRRRVDVHAWISCFDINRRRLSLPKVFAKRRVLPGDKIQGYTCEMIPTEEMRILEKDVLNVELSVLICSCHKKSQSELDLDSNLNKLQLAKL